MTIRELTALLALLPEDTEIVLPAYEQDYGPLRYVGLHEAWDQDGGHYQGTVWIPPDYIADEDLDEEASYYGRHHRRPVVVLSPRREEKDGIR